jgi:hypothetical protein
MNDQTRQSIQFMRENFANLVRTALSRSECPPVGPPFVHSRESNTPQRQKRSQYSNQSIKKSLLNCKHFYSTILLKQQKKKTSR